MIAEGIARYLAAQGLVTYSTAGTSADVFLNFMPSSPDAAVRVWEYGSVFEDAKLGYDTYLVQVLIRGARTRDPRPAALRAANIYSALQGLGCTTLPNGMYLINCVAQAPQGLGIDNNERHEYVINMRCELRAVTTHRE